MPGGSERPTVAAPAWRDEPGPLRWRVLVVLLAAASVVPFAHGFVVLLSSSIPTWFLAALLVMLTGANACILQLPPYRFLHFTSGLVVFAAFFVVGPAVLALTLLSIAATEVLRRIPWIARRFDPLPLGGTPAEYVVPAATIAIALGMVDLRTRSLGLSFPYSAVDPAAEARLLAILAVVYVAILATFELSVVLRFGVRTVLGAPESRADLLGYALAALVGAPVVPAMARVYGPDPSRSLFALAWAFWAFGIFAIAEILVRRRLTIARLTAAIGRQERLASLGRLASVIAHQTRHHLGILDMSAYVLGETLSREPLSDQARERVAKELEAIGRTRGELDALLARELGGKRTEASFDVLELARECADDLAPLASARGVAVQVHGASASTRGDRLRLKQAVTNVLRNAIEAAPAESTVDVLSSDEATGIRLAIRDRGPGFSESARNRLFEPLFTEKSDGLGMGLFVARTIVEAHGGHIEVSPSAPGTTVSIVLATD